MTPIVGGLITAALEIIDKVIPDPQAKANAKLEVLKLEQEGKFKEMNADLQIMLAQTKVNEVEAASPDSFRGGWRPAVGWICALGIFYTYLAQPLLAWYSLMRSIPVPPTLDVFDLLTLLGCMLGFGGMRSFERIRGKA